MKDWEKILVRERYEASTMAQSIAAIETVF